MGRSRPFRRRLLHHGHLDRDLWPPLPAISPKQADIHFYPAHGGPGSRTRACERSHRARRPARRMERARRPDRPHDAPHQRRHGRPGISGWRGGYGYSNGQVTDTAVDRRTGAGPLALARAQQDQTARVSPRPPRSRCSGVSHLGLPVRPRCGADTNNCEKVFATTPGGLPSALPDVRRPLGSSPRWRRAPGSLVSLACRLPIDIGGSSASWPRRFRTSRRSPAAPTAGPSISRPGTASIGLHPWGGPGLPRGLRLGSRTCATSRPRSSVWRLPRPGRRPSSSRCVPVPRRVLRLA